MSTDGWTQVIRGIIVGLSCDRKCNKLQSVARETIPNSLTILTDKERDGQESVFGFRLSALGSLLQFFKHRGPKTDSVEVQCVESSFSGWSGYR
jgi:hypothetical protein